MNPRSLYGARTPIADPPPQKPLPQKEPRLGDRGFGKPAAELDIEESWEIAFQQDNPSLGRLAIAQELDIPLYRVLPD